MDIITNALIATLAMMFTALSTVVLCVVGVVVLVMYGFLYVVGTLSILVVSVYQWWVAVLKKWFEIF